MKKYMMIIALLLMPLAASAEIVTIGVNGLVCSFCATAIEKTFAQKGFDKVNVNLDEKFVTLDVPEGKAMTDKEITAAINDAGYEVTDITRK